MSGLIVAILVVGTCIAVVVAMTTSDLEPATDPTRPDRGSADLPTNDERRSPALAPGVPGRRPYTGATPAAEGAAGADARAPVLARPEPNVPPRWWRRLGSFAVLGALSVAVGAVVASMVLVAFLAALTLLRGVG